MLLERINGDDQPARTVVLRNEVGPHPPLTPRDIAVRGPERGLTMKSISDDA